MNDKINNIHNHLNYLESRINDILYFGLVLFLILFKHIELLDTPRWVLITLLSLRPMYYLYILTIGFFMAKAEEGDDKDER